MAKKKEFTVAIWGEGQQFVAQCLNVDVSSFGDTKKQALKNISEALDLYFEDKTTGFNEITEPTLVTRQMEYA